LKINRGRIKFLASACPLALPVEAGICLYTADLHLLIFTSEGLFYSMLGVVFNENLLG